MDKYEVQELVRRLHYLEQLLDKNGMPTQIIKDAIKYICEQNKQQINIGVDNQ